MSRLVQKVGLAEGAGLFEGAGLYKYGTFDPLSLNPYLLFDAETSMLNSSLETASFLQAIPNFANLATGSNAGSNATQTTALSQPKALPLVDGDGYLYLSGVANNHAYVPSLGYGPSDDHSYYVRCYIPSSFTNSFYILSTRADTIGGVSFFVRPTLDTFSVIVGSTAAYTADASLIPTDQEFGFLITYNGSTNKVSVYINNVTLVDDITANVASWNSTTPFFIGARGDSTTDYTQATLNALGYIKQAKAFSSVVTPSTVATATPVLDVDFTTNVRHGATKFKCATGQIVTINQDSSSSNDVATIIKKPVLRFDGANSGLEGLFNQTVTDGAYMFAAFSVLGDGGEPYTRVFQTINAANNTPVLFSSRFDSENSLYWYSSNNTWQKAHDGMYDDERGDILHELLFTSGLQKSRVNNADAYSATLSESNTEMFSYGIANNHPSDSLSAAIDLEFLSLFPSSITDAQADSVRNYINNRKNVFDLKDGFGYYFYDAQKAPVGAITTGSASWNGRIIGSDFGDSDRYATQGTTNEEPVGDGYVVTFADNADHLDIPQVTQAGWQVVGTSLGTFAYRVNNTAVTELNLLGNFGSAFNRKAGDLYGIILLPESATGADIEEARKLLIDRGAVDVPTFSSSVNRASWVGRSDIVEFKNTDFPQATSLDYAWENCDNMTQIGTVNAPLSTDFTASWKGTNSLRSFPAGAKLGTSAQNVNFTEAWRSSGLLSFTTNLPTGQTFTSCWRQCALKSFGAIDLSAGATFTLAWQQAVDLVSFGAIDARNATTFQEAWKSCSSLQQFPAGAKLGTSAANVNFTSAFRDSGLTSFPADIDLSAGGMFVDTWRGTNLTSFSTPITGVNSKRLRRAWHSCTALTDFSYNVFANWNPSIILTQVFDSTWDGCTALTAQSVGNILQGIDASNQFATVDGNSGSAAIVDAGIDIDYNVDTGSLSAATNAAVTSLKAKGWSIIVNNVTL